MQSVKDPPPYRATITVHCQNDEAGDGILDRAAQCLRRDFSSAQMESVRPSRVATRANYIGLKSTDRSVERKRRECRSPLLH